MPVLADFSLARWEDGILTIGMEPPVPIGGWAMDFTLTRRFGQVSGICTKSVASGYNAQSGITVVNSGQGIFSVAIDSVNTSGLDYGNYSYVVMRRDSGHVTALVEGTLLLSPSQG